MDKHSFGVCVVGVETVNFKTMNNLGMTEELLNPQVPGRVFSAAGYCTGISNIRPF